VSAALAGQLALDLDALSALDVASPVERDLSDLACARSYWAPHQLARIALNKVGTDLYRATISDATASHRGRYGAECICSQTERRGVAFGWGGRFHDGQRRLVTWRRLWNVVREYITTQPDGVTTALILAVAANQAAQCAEFEAIHPIRMRTGLPANNEERAIVEHHRAVTFETFRAQRQAVDAFWADLP